MAKANGNGKPGDTGGKRKGKKKAKKAAKKR